ncbi:thioredoxin family protein [Devosia sp. SL43]|uniref:thioredoxin family protein n=1 Tax=Devosia sp. SL43 TaxID=2806348 RepID=UPI001F408E66|nr:thioredoxin family protein [Devosia sp. SL43]UJW87580.1 thioredoxin family protein [Devosia sp. SL43]
MTLLDRRTALALLAGVAAFAATGAAKALDVVPYSEDALAEAAASGKPYLIDFYATWCSTCAAQQRVLESLAAESAAYAAIPIIQVDWDQHSRGELVARMGIPRRSTLVLMSGTTELGRLVAETRSDRIAGLLDLAAV